MKFTSIYLMSMSAAEIVDEETDLSSRGKWHGKDVSCSCFDKIKHILVLSKSPRSSHLRPYNLSWERRKPIPTKLRLLHFYLLLRPIHLRRAHVLMLRRKARKNLRMGSFPLLPWRAKASWTWKFRWRIKNHWKFRRVQVSRNPSGRKHHRKPLFLRANFVQRNQLPQRRCQNSAK